MTSVVYRVGIICIIIGIAAVMSAQNPHGDAFKMDCAACHSPESWDIPSEYWKEVELVEPKISRTTGMPLPVDTSKFHHNKTAFPLEGQHDAVDCRTCHTSLVFSEAQSDCISCHTDIHQMTVGSDCRRCHTTDNWLVDNIADIHIENGFPLLGAHATANCTDCHQSETALRFERIGNACINCHLADFQATTNPDHEIAGFSTDCAACHNISQFDWVTDEVDHSFFPLEKGHNIDDCARCHIGGDFSGTSPECITCHQSDFLSTEVPDHEVAGFSTDCASCHTTDPGWMPAEFPDHDQLYFPIYSGEHNGTWDGCVDCHTDPSNFGIFTCVSCHQNPETDNAHDEVAGYIYQSTACLACHPTGSEEGSFDHNASAFPLTGAHRDVDCLACHASGYTGTPTACAACHTEDYQGSVNPDHESLGLPMDCASCHTTDPEWMPARFDIHNEYYALNGAHAALANDCASCHNGDYVNTPNTCFGCHSGDYNATSNPNHTSAQFSTDCILCHSESEWVPSTFDHDAQHFPIYSGAHNGEWNQCTDCHTNLNNYVEVTCTGCHTNPETDDEHEGVGGYIYNNSLCLACHPTGDVTNVFDHNMTDFPLTGAHTTTLCLDCHQAGYAGTPTDCAACHQADFNMASNPNHIALGLPSDCASCHTTEPGWMPASFDLHNEYNALNGAHAAIANDCATCHNGDYNNTPNTCFGCHAEDYSAALEPNHQELQLPTDCATCHNEASWTPSTFDHDAFYPFTGAHLAVVDNCAACHIGGNYENTPTDCAGCHTEDFNQTANPNHVALGIPTDCASCHTTEPGWMPAGFDIHNDYYALNGAHAAISNDCAACHNGDYNNTPNTCFGCHAEDFNSTTNPNHVAAMFNTDCATCHTESAWVPSTFDHDAQYFPIYSGAHNGEWSACTDCHTNPANYPEVSCINCHMNPETDEEHEGVNGYSYHNSACLACHPTGSADDNFDHANTGFPLTGAHITTDCIECHAAGYSGTPTDCAACHLEHFNQAMNPNHVALNLPTDCAACHTTEPGWMPASFAIHDEYWPLTGAHAAVADDCASCHNGDYNNTPNTCFGCHAEDYNTASDPNHQANQMPTTCEDCHTNSAWVPSTFDHAAFYPFTGAHIPVANDCALCHIGGNYENTPTDCAGCHTDDYNSSSNPNHVGLNIPTDCASCHSTEPDWMPATFDIHNDYYALNGAHAVIANDCAACHNGDYNNTPNTCFGCHADEYNATTNPNHVEAGFPTTCAECHSEDAWTPANFNHNEIYPLVGAHAVIANDCALCHIGGNYSNTPNTCVGCHEDDYNATTNPDHVDAGFPTTCTDCHTEDAWTPANFDHNAFYPLNGAHAVIANDCALCHIGGNYNNTPNTCVGCHEDDYNATTNPDHLDAGFPTTCADCHTEDAWTPANFDHNAFYPLNGAHAVIANDCALCHIGGNYSNIPNTCVGCHEDDYNQATDPEHLANQLPVTCEDCHNETAWIPADFDHDAFFPFTGAHIPIANDCALCHIGGNYSNTPNTCAGCHTDNYNSSTNPDHQALNLPTDCASCHTTDPDWMPATFDIHNDYYVLNGAHAVIANDCAACHNGDYNNTPNTCFGCHENDYNQANDPDHAAAGFPTTCESCHTENAWSPANWDHDNMYFPIYSGKHDGEWNTCTDCHIGGNYNSFSCIDCHEHDDPVLLADIHDQVPGYEYASPACYSCHPTGED